MADSHEIPPEMEAKTSENDENVKKIENTENPAQTSCPPANWTKPPEPEQVFKTKKIRFNAEEYNIVTQNANGPCPLISIMNALVLKKKLRIIKHPEVSSNDLINLLGGFIMQEMELAKNTDREAVFEKNMEDVLKLMPSLLKGLDVNIKFSAVDAFVPSDVTALFDLTSVKLYHVWIPDDQLSTYDLISKSNYEELCEKALIEEDSDEKMFIRSFLDDTITQGTFIGLTELFKKMPLDELAVLYYNNHFSTLLKKTVSIEKEPWLKDELFKLVSDEGYADKPNVVWETFTSLDGCSHLVDSDFHNSTPVPQTTELIPLAPPTSSSATVTQSTFELQEEAEEGIEIGQEAVMEPPPAPPSSTVSTPRGNGNPTVASSHAHHATVSPRQSQERTAAAGAKSEGKGCSLM